MKEMTMRARRIAAMLLFAILAAAGPLTGAALGQTVEIQDGAGARLRTISPAELDALPAATVRTSTPWSESALYEGPRLTDILRLIGRTGFSSVRLTAADDYAVQIPLTDIERLNPILARKQDGKPLALRTRGPYWLMFAFDDTPEIRNDTWYYRAVWQITRISLLP